MSNFMRRMGLASSLGMLVMLGACGDDDEKPTDTTDTTDVSETTPDVQPDVTPDVTPDVEPDTVTPTYATLTFSIDDSANKTFDATDKLQWKGSFAWNEDTNVVTLDTAWGGPFPMLYDDGPPPTGSEKPGAVANDGIWTTAVMVATPAADLTLEYGAAYGEGAANWIWTGTNGTVTVPAGSTGQVDAVGLTIAAHGTIDLLFSIDVSNQGANLAALFQGSTYTDVKVKSSAWGWAEIALVDDGTKGDATAADGKYTFRLSDNLTKHAGLVKPGDMPQFVFVLGGVEYKEDGAPPADGVTAWVSDGTTNVVLEIDNMAEGDKNTFVTVPNKVMVSFSIDDSANETYEAVDNLEWKGSFNYDAATNVATFDGSWPGPYPKLYDDGPPPAGKEAPGATAGDNIWTTAVWVSNAGGSFEYGAQRDGGAWIWTGSNGTFTVPAGTLTPIVAQGLTIAAHGTIDLRLEIDVSGTGANLNALFQGVDYTGKVKVKGSAWGWAEKSLLDTGANGDVTANDGKYVFLLSDNLGKHEGLLKVGDKPEFIFVLDGSEYKNASAQGAQEGVDAWTDYGTPGMDYCVAPTAQCMSETIEVVGNGNTSVTVGTGGE